ncbi:uncharacterized protein LOC132557129 [Ylistrum balloti]|uniref:uncharacterized protein LOC132557129 n=1 Tax=Ylistrum balloti TaxID=509963 RepID=UPI002905B7EC|nr:uncharacterized protein LOC132557129 [Ylistrum balloti]
MASLHDSSFYCISEHELPQQKRLVYTIISLLSASLGIFGASWQIITYGPETQDFLRRINNKEKQQRHSIQPNPMIVLFLAVTNLTSCVGSVLRSVATFVVKPPSMADSTNTTLTSTCPTYGDTSFIPMVSKEVKVAGGILEAFTDFSYVASAMWTLSFAINIYSQLVGRHIQMKLFHLWTWSVSSAYLAILMYTSVIYMRCPGLSLLFTKLTATVGREERAIIQRLRIRFFWIVFFFALCWLPNIVDCFFHIDLLTRECLYQLDSWLFPLWIIEALMNPLQGLFNCFLYGRKCSCKPFVITARTRRHYTQIVDIETDRSYTGLLNNSSYTTSP